MTAGGEGGLRLQAYFGHGSWAERMRVPTENAVRIGAIDAADAPRWSAIGTLPVPYGGLLAANLQAGETVLVNGATGNFGSAGVAVALAMGASLVVATGRNERSLADLVRRFGRRVRPVRLRGDETADRAQMSEAAEGASDCVLDLLPPAADAAWARSAVMTLGANGRAVLMGGVGMPGGGGLDLPYAWIMRNNITIRGQWMYPRLAVSRMAQMIRAGLVALDQFEVAVFDLDYVNEAVAHAAAHAGPFKNAVIRV